MYPSEVDTSDKTSVTFLWNYVFVILDQKRSIKDKIRGRQRGSNETKHLEKKDSSNMIKVGPGPDLIEGVEGTNASLSKIQTMF